MHIYIYDEFANTNKYDSVLARIETRITDLGLNGKIIRLGLMKDILSAINNEIKRGAKTITAVGNDATVNKVLRAMIDSCFINELELAVPLGYIPIGKEKLELAEILGIPTEEDACDILSTRRIEKIDLGRANDQYFIGKATINSQNTVIEIENKFSLEIKEAGVVDIYNLPSYYEKSNPQDGILELLISTQESKKLRLKKNLNRQSFFSVKNITIANQTEPLLLDGGVEIKTPAEISVLKNKLNIIVGKERKF